MRLDLYEEICVLDESEEKKVFLVRDSSSHMLYIKMLIYNTSLWMNYETLKENSHPHLVQVINSWREQENLVVIQEYVNGVSLAYYISKRSYTLQECVKILDELFSVMKYLHQLQPCIVQCDIKPENIYFDGQGLLKLMYMETAQHGQEEDVNSQQNAITQTDVQNDIYAIGKLIKVLYYGEVASELPRIALTALIRRCMMDDPKERYQSIDELQQAYHTAIGVGDISYYTAVVNTDVSRRENLIKNILSWIGYVLIFWFSMNIAYATEDYDSIFVVWTMGITCFLGLSSSIFILRNVGDIRKFSPFKSSGLKIIRQLGVVLLWYIIASTIVITGAIISTFF